MVVVFGRTVGLLHMPSEAVASIIVGSWTNGVCR